VSDITIQKLKEVGDTCHVQAHLDMNFNQAQIKLKLLYSEHINFNLKYSTPTQEHQHPTA
jgi:hypothetical protein